MSTTTQELWVARDNIDQTKLATVKLGPIKEDEVLCRIDSFGLSANNVTYAVLGQSYRYFDFFPTSDAKYANVPIWGMATVTDSNSSAVKVGERVYGYFPIAQHHVLKVKAAANGSKEGWFYVPREHLPEDRKVYNQYFRASADPFYDPRHEGEMLLFRPLFWTSFFLADYLKENKYYGAKTVIISSASSKTAFCFAFLAQASGIRTIGLTSPSSVPFVKSLGYYDSIYTYDQISSIPKDSTVLYVDVSGSKALATDVFNHIGASNIRRSVSVGMSNAQEAKGTFPGETEIFFAPTWIKKRQDELRDQLPRLQAKAWKEAMDRVDNWVKLSNGHGPASVEKLWKTMVNGRTAPDVGYVMSLWKTDAGSKL
ncbi:uncharacterized protein EV422DRAFT_527846 [Fimicolochytrium jonesii]|uniref:uncharacterized protein n=1 Tax=Fimicolochytrium jonesii TaxID=1396493 RepID=UPI0022FEF811|nr:uncharacterized protein EV422DRAFT_527846 [Fimicolochytrium jonesii]KAI8821353.1 hypothetical protein EV422DRAFT_527846 [Fimicolochytrium jonesii]